MPNIPAEIYAPLGELSRGLDIPTAGAKSAMDRAYHSQREIRVATEAVAGDVREFGQHEDIQANSDISNRFTALELQKRDEFEKAVANDPDGKIDATQWYKDHVQPDADKIHDLVGSDKTLEHFVEVNNRFSIGLQTEWHGELNKIHQNRAVTTSDDNYTLAAKNVADNPASLVSEEAKARAKTEGVFSAANVPLDFKTQHYDEQKHILGDVALKAITDKAELNAPGTDIDALRKAITAPDSPYRTYSSAGAYSDALRKLDAAQATRGDISAAVASTTLPGLYKQLAETGQGATQIGQIIANGNGGKSPQEIAKWQAEQALETQKAQSTYTATQAYRLAPDSAINDKLTALNGDLAKANTPGARTDIESQTTALTELMKGRREEYARDPIGYVTRYDGTASNAYQAYKANPSAQTFQPFALAVAAKEASMNPGAVPKILPPEMEQDIAAQMRTVDQTPEGAVRAGDVLRGLQQTTGTFFNYALHELQDKHILTGGQFAAAQVMGTPQGIALGQEMLRAQATPEKILVETSGVPTEAAKGAMRTALAPLTATFADTVNGHELMASYIDAGAAVLQSRGPGHLGDAQALTNTMVLDRFNVRSNLRIPKSFDDRDVSNGADIVQAGIDKHDIQPPPSFSGFGPALQKDAYIQDLKDYGYWGTNDRGDGAVLRYQGLPVYEKIKNGQSVPVEIPFKDLQNVGRDNRSAYDKARRFVTAPQTLSGSPSIPENMDPDTF